MEVQKASWRTLDGGSSHSAVVTAKPWWALPLGSFMGPTEGVGV